MCVTLDSRLNPAGTLPGTALLYVAGVRRTQCRCDAFPIRHSRVLLSGIHCLTLDSRLKRAGTLPGTALLYVAGVRRTQCRCDDSLICLSHLAHAGVTRSRNL